MTIHERIKTERERLGLSQTAFGAIGGVGKTTVISWERGTAFPNAAFLAAVANAGADVQYIVTGILSASAIAPDEQVLLDGYRSLDQATRRRMLAFMLTESGPVAVQKNIQEKVAATNAADKYRGAKIGTVTEGDFTGTAHIQVGGGKGNQ